MANNDFNEFPINGIDNKIYAKIDKSILGINNDLYFEIPQVTLIKISTQKRNIPAVVMNKLPIGFKSGRKMTSFSLVIRNSLRELGQYFVEQVNNSLKNVDTYAFTADGNGNLVQKSVTKNKTEIKFSDLMELPIFDFILINTPQDGNVYRKTLSDIMFFNSGSSEDASSTENNTFTEGLVLSEVTKWIKDK